MTEEVGEIKDKLSARAFVGDYVAGNYDGMADAPTEWYATELHGEPMDVSLNEPINVVMDIIAPITKQMRATLLSLYTFYKSNGTRVFMVFEFDFVQDDIVSYLVLPQEVFEKMFEWKTHEYDVWNEVSRKAIDDDEPPVKMESKKEKKE